MSFKAKYQPVLDLGEKFGIKDGFVNDNNDRLEIGGVAATQYEKDRIWDKIKELGGENPNDIMADIKVENTAYYHKHVVSSGETLGKIAKQYYGKAGAYMKIFEANTNILILKDPNVIFPNQELIIPNP